MKRHVIQLAVVGIILGAGAVGYSAFHGTKRDDEFRTVPVRRQDIEQIVTSTGTVQPVLSVQVGAFVSGPVEKVLVDFNAKVKKDDILAQINPRSTRPLAHAKAALAHSQADKKRVEALLEQAIHNEKRARQLKPANAIAETDFDQCLADRKSFEAQVLLANADIEQCKADLDIAETNVKLCMIRSPVDGIVIDRKVDPGQTVVSQFQTPNMFVVAPDLEKKVYVFASVDEADVGLIRDAQQRKQLVTFTVDAYPRDEFRGKIAQVRFNPTTVQNVVTYTAVVESPNPALKLLPGMTANLSFRIQKRTGVLTVPNGALRFYPKPEQVCQRDRWILEGTPGEERGNPAPVSHGAIATGGNQSPSAAVRTPQRYVWIVENDLLSAVPIGTGLSDKGCTEIVSGDLHEGQQVVAGQQTSSTN